jgi:hypothetical protein
MITINSGDGAINMEIKNNVFSIYKYYDSNEKWIRFVLVEVTDVNRKIIDFFMNLSANIIRSLFESRIISKKMCAIIFRSIEDIEEQQYIAYEQFSYYRHFAILLTNNLLAIRQYHEYKYEHEDILNSMYTEIPSYNDNKLDCEVDFITSINNIKSPRGLLIILITNYYMFQNSNDTGIGHDMLYLITTDENYLNLINELLN